MKKRSFIGLLSLMTVFAVGCGSTETAQDAVVESTVEATETVSESETQVEETQTTEETESTSVEETEVFDTTQVQVFAAASLNDAMTEIAELYAQVQPNVSIVINADSSGTLLTQVEEGYACDIFFSAAVKQMKSLEEEGYVLDGTRVDLLKNQVVLITPKNSNSTVTGIENLQDASSFALADGSVPVGKYTRTALMNAGILESVEDASLITTEEVSEALGGIEINECGNVSKVKEAIKEGNNEIGTVYYSDAYSVKDDVDIICYLDEELTGEIVYPVAQLKNEEADELETAAAADFENFLQTEEALEIFEKYMFIVK